MNRGGLGGLVWAGRREHSDQHDETMLALHLRLVLLTTPSTSTRRREPRLSRRHKRGRRRNINHARMLGVTLVLLQQRQERHGEVELALNIHMERLIPSLVLRKIVHRRSPGQPRIVDEDIKLRLALLDFVGESIAAGFGGDVGLDGDTGGAADTFPSS